MDYVSDPRFPSFVVCWYSTQRPLEDIANREGSVFVPRGVDVPCLDQDKDWEFKPCNFREGQVCMEARTREREEGGGDIKHGEQVAPSVRWPA